MKEYKINGGMIEIENGNVYTLNSKLVATDIKVVFVFHKKRKYILSGSIALVQPEYSIIHFMRVEKIKISKENNSIEVYLLN